MKIAYTSAEQGWEVPKPSLRLIMCSQNKRIAVDGLIDSGSDHNLFNMKLVKVCGIDLTYTTKITVSGFNHDRKGKQGYLVPVKFNLGNYEWVGDTIFVNTDRPYGLLGQQGFFDAFNVSFFYTKKVIEI